MEIGELALGVRAMVYDPDPHLLSPRDDVCWWFTDESLPRNHLHWEELPYPKVHPLLGAVCIQWLTDTGTQRLVLVPQVGTSLKGYPRLITPVVLAGISNVNYITVQCHLLPSSTFLTLLQIVFLKYFPVNHLQANAYLNICLQTMTAPSDSQKEIPW